MDPEDHFATLLVGPQNDADMVLFSRSPSGGNNSGRPVSKRGELESRRAGSFRDNGRPVPCQANRHQPAPPAMMYALESSDVAPTRARQSGSQKATPSICRNSGPWHSRSIDMNKKPLSGKAAAVTGGGRGLGRAIALAFSRAGANLAICSRSIDELEEVKCSSEAPAILILAVSAVVSGIGRLRNRVWVRVSRAGPGSEVINFVVAAGFR